MAPQAQPTLEPADVKEVEAGRVMEAELQTTIELTGRELSPNNGEELKVRQSPTWIFSVGM